GTRVARLAHIAVAGQSVVSARPRLSGPEASWLGTSSRITRSRTRPSTRSTSRQSNPPPDGLVFRRLVPGLRRSLRGQSERRLRGRRRRLGGSGGYAVR